MLVISVEGSIQGTLPPLAGRDSEVDLSDYSEDFTEVRPGLITASSSRYSFAFCVFGLSVKQPSCKSGNGNGDIYSYKRPIIDTLIIIYQRTMAEMQRYIRVLAVVSPSSMVIFGLLSDCERQFPQNRLICLLVCS